MDTHSSEVFRKEIKFSLRREIFHPFEVDHKHTLKKVLKIHEKKKKREINSIDCIYNSQKTLKKKMENIPRKEDEP